MENSVFDDILTEGTAVDTDDENQEENDFDHSFDLSDDDLTSDEDDETIDEPEQDEAEESDEEATLSNPTNTAFAQMRTQNKEFQNKLNQLDSLAKDLGMKDLDDFIAKANEAKIKKSATNQGIPLEVARELEEMRSSINSIVAEREENAAKQKEQTFVSNLQEFVNSNNLSKTAVDKLSQDLEKDGFSIEALMAMPKNALNKVLGSYVDTKYQKNLERKNTIRKELPINQASKIDTQSLNKEIDALARHLAGKD